MPNPRLPLALAALLLACADPPPEDTGFVETSGGECLPAPEESPTGPTVAELDVPEPVRASLRAIFGDDAVLEVEGGDEEWEVEQAAEMELEMGADGVVSSMEFTVPPALLPPAVAQAVQACWGEAELGEVEVVVRGDALLWEVEAEADEEEREASFRPDGGFEDGDACGGEVAEGEAAAPEVAEPDA